jgi:aminomethyltransferase
MCLPTGGIVDDLTVFRLGERRFFFVVNASTAAKDFAWIREHTRGATARDRSAEFGLLALQGPRAEAILRRLTRTPLAELAYFHMMEGVEVAGRPGCFVSRTGYTGEDGFEIYAPAAEAVRVWQALLAVGRPLGLQPIGLGARDTLRLEAGMPLYGHEIDEAHNPIEAGLAFGVSFASEKGDWIGRAALERVRAAPRRRLVGITTAGPRVPRQGHELYRGAEKVGYVVSGSVSPTLGTNIGSAYLRLGADRSGTELELDVKGKRQPCTVRELPFYSRTRK